MLLLIKSRVCNIMLIRAPTPVDLATEEENVGKAEKEQSCNKSFKNFYFQSLILHYIVVLIVPKKLKHML